MNKKVVAISFQTANYNRSSVCSIGIALYEDDKIKLNQEILINPEEEFEKYYTNIHGIDEETVKDSGNFKRAWNSLNRLIDTNTLLISSNASLDISIFIHLCDKYNIIYPNIEYLCTWKLSKIIYKELENNEEKDTHNKSSEEALACLKSYIDILSKSDYENIDDLLNFFNIEKGSLSNKSYKPFGIKKYKYRREFNIQELKSRTYDFENHHPFYKKSIVFTGALESMRRSNAMKKVNVVGGLGSNTISKNTDYLVIGRQSVKKLNGRQKSSKQISAERLIQQGANLKIISEDEFLELV